MTNKFHLLCCLLLLFCVNNALAQETDSLNVRAIFDEALVNGECYENLHSLCKDIGARLSGSAEAEMAVQWGKAILEGYGFKTWLQKTPIPHWERGTTEVAWYKGADGELKKIKVLALGGSVGTEGIMSAECVEAKDLDHVKELGEAGLLKGKIVFINKPFDQRFILTGRAYGGCWPIRGNGASTAAKYGAKASVIRSLATPIDNHPHTGSMRYEDDVKKIPGAAISTQASNDLSAALKKGTVEFTLEMDCRNYPDKISHNVIGELTGTEFPDEIITIGGHLDSWDVGEGAHDDGAGVVHCIEALRILKELDLQPKRTVRVVLFMNEENGAYGASTYAKDAIEKDEKHVFALESDAGGHTPLGFSLQGTDSTRLALLQSFRDVLEPYGLQSLKQGFGGVDINKLKEHYPDITLIGLRPDTQRYFNYHHSETDVFENVNKRELELGSASIAAIVHLLDKHWLGGGNP